MLHMHAQYCTVPDNSSRYFRRFYQLRYRKKQRILLLKSRQVVGSDQTKFHNIS